ncbi:MAG TPA: hypothetical protein VN577_21955 [Terriglobales bacterium]|nr:hypothetical protein [Terriglobales bacterium]
MSSIPLHPALVHLPLGLAFILPILAIGFTWALWTKRIQPRAWLVIIVLQAILLAAGLLAMNTGEREGERVERVVAERAIETHEAFAEQFVWAVGMTLAVGVLVLIPQSRVARALAIATVAGTFAVAGLAVRVGHAGGKLVYVHNAAAAYAQSDVRSAQVQTSGTPERQPEDSADQD